MLMLWDKTVAISFAASSETPLLLILNAFIFELYYNAFEILIIPNVPKMLL